MRAKQPSILLRDFVTNTIMSPPDSSMLQSDSLGTLNPIEHYVNCDKFSTAHRAFLAGINEDVETRDQCFRNQSNLDNDYSTAW